MFENQTLNVSIGQRIEATTYRETLRLDRNAIMNNPEFLDKVLESGVYSILAGMKNVASNELQSPAQFRAWAQSVTVEHIQAYATRETKHGRAVEYSQADRIRDAKVLMRFQVALINYGKLLPLTTWMPLDEAVKNANARKLAEAKPDLAQWNALIKAYGNEPNKAIGWCKDFPIMEMTRMEDYIYSL